MSAVDIRYELDLAPLSVWIMVTPDTAVKRAAPHALELGDFFAGEKYFTRRSNLPSYLIKYTLEGAGRLEYDGREEAVGPRRAFWIDCMRPQYYRTDPAEGRWRVVWVHFFGPCCAAYYQWFLNENGGRNAVELPAGTAVPALINKLISIYRDGDNALADDVTASALLVRIMAEFVAAGAGRARDDAETPARVALARAYLLEHFNESVSLSDLAEVCALDRFYLQKLFKKHVGVSPKKFQALTRVNRAKELLQTTALPVSEIAGLVGVESASRFIGLFRAYEGLTPGAYRQKWRGK